MPAIGDKASAIDTEGTLRFFLNGKEQIVCIGTGYSPSTSLNEYIREKAGLTGTKVMCREAGCGCCAVTVNIPDHTGSSRKTQSINSCLCPLFSVDGWHITTAEGIGNEKEGFHPIQERIAKFNGTQCGYCTPGMVMNMYGLLHDNAKPTEQDIEDNFDGNICRCTGYRSILDSMKSFAVDTTIDGGGVIDIEDLNKKICPRTGLQCKDEDGHSTNGAAKNGSAKNGSATNGSSAHSSGFSGLHIRTGGVHWYRPTSLQEVGNILRRCKEDKVHLIFGNTAAGIFKDEGPFDVYIDLHEVKELYNISVTETNVKLGANTTLSELIKHLKTLKDTQPGFEYFAALVRHLKLVGNVLMRNAASIAGNLMIKHAHPGFPSDVFAMIEAAGGKVEIYDTRDGVLKAYTLQDFVKKVNMTGKVLTTIELPALDQLDHFRSFKITPRSQNAHAYVNAAFRLKLSEPDRQILGKPAIVYGGINEHLCHAEQTEEYLRGKQITNETVQGALAILQAELKPTADPVLSSPEYRRDLAVNLLYKTLLSVGNNIHPKLLSGGFNIERPLSSGLQTYQEKKDEWPLKQPMPKLTANLQASGEAEYINDMPRYRHELCAALVITTLANATIESVDPSPALAMPGVIQYISVIDIPKGGFNDAFANYTVWPLGKEEVFCTGKVECAGQTVGLILAESQLLADAAAKKVTIKYKDIQKPILTIEEAIEAKSFHPMYATTLVVGTPDDAIAKSAKTVSGEVNIGSQYHFYMETIVTLCVPTEEGLEVYANAQSGDVIQCVVAGILNKPLNYINVHIPRIGGGFGGKFLTSAHVACATAVAAYAVGRPVRISLPLSTTMQCSGKRFPVLARYKAGFSEVGQMEAIVADLYVDTGYSTSMQFVAGEMQGQLDQGFYIPNWKLTPYLMKTNKPPSNTVRGPGTTPASVIIETILEHVANEIKQHPIIVKELNLYEKHQTDLGGRVLVYCTMREVWNQLKTIAEVEKRMKEVDAFNQASQWKKRGITMSAVKYGMLLQDHGMPCMVSIFANDGTVTVVQGGVEMGQGLFTKVAQAVAHSLGIPVDMIKVRPNLSYAAPNASVTGGSTTSEKAVHAALECSKILRERLEPIKAKMPDADWKTLIQSARSKIDLSAKVSPFGGDLPSESGYFAYFTYCAAVMETELDVLTGEYAIRRVDIMFDCGESLNPTIDIGQIEGGFVFGLGFNLLEDTIYDKGTGQVLNDGTWEYKPPTTKDIPIDWRIHLLPDAPNPMGVRGSKATGEPPTGLSVGAMLAVKQCVMNAQKDLKGTSSFSNVEIPFTVEKIQQSVGIKLDNLSL